MLLSLALIFLCGMFLGKIFSLLKLPSLLGLIITGIILGPYCLNLLDGSILSISADLRELALIIILTRAGLNLDIEDLKRVGRPAILMCFIPASFEIIGMVLIAPRLFNITLFEAALMGSVVAAVSPAVLVPKMLKLIDERYGTNKSIPQLLMAGASVDDIFVIVLFASFTSLVKGGSVSALDFLKIPTSIIFGLLIGVIIALILTKFFTRFHIRDSAKVVIILSISFILVTIENSISKVFNGIIGFSGLLAVMSVGAFLKAKKQELSKRLSLKYSKLWVAAEIMLFVLVGAAVNIKYALNTGFTGILLIFAVLIFRMLGVLISLIKTNLNKKERIFSMIAYCPKATVQAAIGSIPLSLGFASGEIILTIAVLAILITAPLGSFAIEFFYKRLLEHE
ncbi:cation:proton antiporter [Brachyspira innocens]|uniref:Cation:proton antiporter n=1 Tax=Brachyspira innocens TaxID=13264 RepID=A0ABT8YZ92_9SPIR|nr:cation:proton antiporter [Brachyspira innocens]MDO6993993.1 cation:proton antiporter [Brachyspira innocens]MDO7021206.1 cation:proton antiporter [Brachyspira innocens]